jgi:hypothetical protein
MSTDGSSLGYAELLRLAVSKGLQELDTTIVQIPSEENRGHAVVTASVRTASTLYRAIGEAWWDSTEPGTRRQALLEAEMGAKTRALCEAVGMPQRITEAMGATRHPAAQLATLSGALAHDGVPERATEPPVQVAGSTEPPASSARAAREAVPTSQPGPAANAVGTSDRPATHAVLSAARTLEQGDVHSEDVPQVRDPVEVESASPGVRPRLQPARPAPAGEGLGPDILQKLLHMTQRIGELKHDELTEEEALAKLDSFFQRAFNHPLAEGTRMEGQRVVQRLASDLARLSQEGGAYAAS